MFLYFSPSLSPSSETRSYTFLCPSLLLLEHVPILFSVPLLLQEHIPLFLLIFLSFSWNTFLYFFPSFSPSPRTCSYIFLLIFLSFSWNAFLYFSPSFSPSPRTCFYFSSSFSFSSGTCSCNSLFFTDLLKFIFLLFLSFLSFSCKLFLQFLILIPFLGTCSYNTQFFFYFPGILSYYSSSLSNSPSHFSTIPHLYLISWNRFLQFLTFISFPGTCT